VRLRLRKPLEGTPRLAGRPRRRSCSPADATFSIHAHFERPEWENVLDMDRSLAGETRRDLLDQAVRNGMLILGYHLPFPGLGYAVPYEDAFRWHPAGWRVLP
jgi:hypothetical protein